MDESLLKRQFESMGASLRIATLPNAVWRFRHRRLRTAVDYTVDVVQQPQGQEFALDCRQGVTSLLEVQVLDVRPRDRHLLLMVALAGQKRKFLCGHDERHWFVAGLPDTSAVKNIADAFEALKPPEVQASLHMHRVRKKGTNRHRNQGFYRQGEWFFVPRPDFAPKHACWILHHEPIQRGRSKPHMVEELCRLGGETVHVCEAYPNGLTEEEYRQLLGRKPHAKAWVWRTMRRNMRVFARGKVRHPDHKTLVLPGWYEVLMSAERMDEEVAFLD